MPPTPTVIVGELVKVMLCDVSPTLSALPEASNKAGAAATAEVLVVVTFFVTVKLPVV